MRDEINIAVIDLYNNEKNEGMRCIREISEGMAGSFPGVKINYSASETRYKGDIPSMDNDIFISSGGPGSPFEDEGSRWEKDYFNLISSVWEHNRNNDNKKYMFFICHSFQLMARFFNFAQVNERGTKSFGVVPFAKTPGAEHDAMFTSLPDPFYAADFRQFQVVQPNQNIFDQLGASILSKEIEGAQNAEGAVMAVRISNEIAGTQFHPEADPESMIYHLMQPERKEYIVKNYGEKGYDEMLSLLNNEQAIKLTRRTIMPSFLGSAITNILKY